MEAQTAGTDDRMGIFRRLIGVFVAPGATFASLNVLVGFKDWLIPMLLVAVAVGMSAHITAPVTQKFSLEMTRAQFDKKTDLTDEQKEKAIQRVAEFQKSGGAIGTVTAPVMMAILMFISAAVFLALANFLLGGEATYKKVLAVVSLSYLITIPALIVSVPLILSQGTPLVHLGPGVLLPESMSHTYLSAVLFHLNIFTIWQYALVSIGLGAVAGISTKKAAWGVFILLILYALGMGGIQSLAGGMG